MSERTGNGTELSNGSNIVCVVHRLPHRTRLRIKKSPQRLDHLSKANEILKDTPGIQQVEVNPDTGSLLILHDDQAGHSVENAISNVVRTLELLVPEAGLEDGGLIQVSNSLYPLVNMFDDKLSQWSDNTVDLRTLFPLALAYLGLRKMSETGNLLGNISPLVLLYYAFDSYYKLNRKSNVGFVSTGSNSR